MDVTIKVRRFDPEADNPESYWQEFTVGIEDGATVLDALIKIREEVDGTLSLRCSCRSAICGSCAMRINGPRLPGLQDSGADRPGPGKHHHRGTRRGNAGHQRPGGGL